MSYTLSVFLLRAWLPSAESLHKALATQQIQLLTDTPNLTFVDGFLPVLSNGVESGFELHPDPVTDEERNAYKQALLEDGEDSDSRYQALLATDLWLMFTCRGSDDREVRAATAVARTIAAAAGGWYEDPQTRETTHHPIA